MLSFSVRNGNNRSNGRNRTLALALALLCNRAEAANSSYALLTEMRGASFYDAFDFYTGADPTHGTVRFVSQAEAETSGLINATDGAPAYMGADHAAVVADGSGRPSVRIESKARFDEGLFVITLNHLPTGCGTWPAFWMCAFIFSFTPNAICFFILNCNHILMISICLQIF
jgi:hypothetical protein